MSVLRWEGPDRIVVEIVMVYVRSGVCSTCGVELWTREGESGRYALVLGGTAFQPHYGYPACQPPQDVLPLPADWIKSLGLGGA